MGELNWTAGDGTALHGTVTEPAGGSDRLPLLCLAGLTRNGRDFARLAETLTTHPVSPRTVVTMDYRGRGRSGYADPTSYTPQVEADDVRRGLAEAGVGRCAVLGTSRGGLIATMLAMALPAGGPAALGGGASIGPVILNDIGPVIEIDGLLRIRGGIEALLGDAPATWTEAEDRLLRLQGEAFPKVRGAELSAVARQMFRDEAGRPVPDFDPALLSSLANLSADTPMPPLWPLFDALATERPVDGSPARPRPLLVIRGGLSDILSAATLDAMRARLPHLETHVVPDEGHAPLLRDEATIAVIADFLARADEAEKAAAAS